MNNTIPISNYLQNEMSAEERTAFEAQLAVDARLREELFVQQQIIQAAKDAGIKTDFTKAIRQRLIVRRIITWSIASVVITAVVLVFVFTNKMSPTITSTDNSNIATQRFINPPSPVADVPYSQYSFDAAKGDTIFHASGSILCFPANAFKDANGDIVKGLVNISYREFADPVDFFVSGIPMQYDSAGKQYNFESSGMCDIKAFQNGHAIFVNEQAKPQINLSGKNNSPLHNLYVLDTVSRKWVFAGKDVITEVKKVKANTSSNIIADGIPESPALVLTKPVAPIKSTPGRPTFSVAIDEDALEELHLYDKQRFEVLESDRTYDPADANEHWDDVKVEKTNQEGIYTIIFTNAKRKVNYKVRPVLSGEDYIAALKLFNEKNEAYQQAVVDRSARTKFHNDSVQKENARILTEWNNLNAENKRINALIEARNLENITRYKAMQARQKQQDKENAAMMAKQEQQNKENAAKFKEIQEQMNKRNAEIVDSLYKLQAHVAQDALMNVEIIRSFNIDRFGVWNCDHPQYNNLISISPLYVDVNKNKNINLNYTAVVYRGFNGIMQFAGNSFIRVLPKMDNMLLAIQDDTLYYYSYNDFRSSGISPSTKTFSFFMHSFPQKITSYGDVRAFIKQIE